ncbi:hypothetical protein COP2_011772 [Malus domestica]
MNIPAVFSDYCKEACHLGARCISSVTWPSSQYPYSVKSIQATDGGGRQCSCSSFPLKLLPLWDVKLVGLKSYALF